jgi:hypothetical protein
MAYTDIFELINNHKNNISHSFLFYRPISKIHKLNVLNSALKYLSGKMSKRKFIDIIKRNPKYADAIGISQTKLLVDEVLRSKQSIHRTKEEYVKGWV